MLSLAALLLGVINTVALVATAVRTDSLDADQNSICSTVSFNILLFDKTFSIVRSVLDK